MVQVLPQQSGIGSEIGQSLGMGLQSGLSQAMQHHFDQRKSEQQLAQKEKSLSDFLQSKEGSKLSPLQKTALSAHSKGLIPESSLKSIFEPTDTLADEKSYGTMKDAFGEKFANIWKSSDPGARTELVRFALDAHARGKKIDDLFGNVGAQKPPEQTIETKSGDEVPEYTLPTEGMKPNEIVAFKGQLRKDNMPIWKESQDRLKGAKLLSQDIKILDQINKKKNLPEGAAKLFINPETGAPYEVTTAIHDQHPDVQRWVKTIARQATQAQTSFPGRVTNFDLQSYMRQFPSLFNTYEGREIILQQMKLTNQATIAIESALDKVYAKNKLGGITPEDAFDMAKQIAQPELDMINNQLLALGQEGELIANTDSINQSSSVPRGMVLMFDPEGNELHVPQDQVEKYRSLGAISK